MTAVVRRQCASADEAARLGAAIAADNPSFVGVTVEGSDLVLRVAAASAASVRATLEDLLACLSAAERSPPPG